MAVARGSTYLIVNSTIDVIYGVKIDYTGSDSQSCKLYIVSYTTIPKWPKSTSGKVLIPLTMRTAIKFS